ncbi:hypothetical protein GCM10029964_057820 [Kibdelosporangium lantanae]
MVRYASCGLCCVIQKLCDRYWWAENLRGCVSDDSASVGEVLAASDVAFAVTDQRCRVKWVNPRMAELFGLSPEQSVGRSLPALLAGAPESPTDGLPGVVVSWQGPDDHRWLEITCQLLGTDLLFRAADVTRWRDQELRGAKLGHRHEDLLRMVEEDPLTGLPNRRALTRELERQLALGVGGALLLLDLDNFKDINDLRGHPAGDRVMCTLANLLRDRLGEGQVVGRLGGDEFAVVLPGADEREAVTVADRLRTAVAAVPLAGGSGATRTTISAGVARFDTGESWQAILANADLALYASKAAGRNRVTVYEQGHYTDTALRVSVLDRLRGALQDGGFALHAMPMVKLASGRVVGHELLLRLEDNKHPVSVPASSCRRRNAATWYSTSTGGWRERRSTRWWSTPTRGCGST